MRAGIAAANNRAIAQIFFTSVSIRPKRPIPVMATERRDLVAENQIEILGERSGWGRVRRFGRTRLHSQGEFDDDPGWLRLTDDCFSPRRRKIALRRNRVYRLQRMADIERKSGTRIRGRSARHNRKTAEEYRDGHDYRDERVSAPNSQNSAPPFFRSATLTSSCLPFRSTGRGTGTHDALPVRIFLIR